MATPPALRFSANYRRFTPTMTAALGRIWQALGTIRGARVLPAVADQLRASARVGTVHYSNLIEGNELPLIEAERAARGELSRDSRAKIELVNYVRALDLIDERLDSGDLELETTFLEELHGAATEGLGRQDDPHFKPHHEGAWRDGQAIVADRLTGRILHEGPPAEEVPLRMKSLLDWVHQKLQLNTEPPFVVAGVAHYGITDVHPFADGNGRAARLFQAAVLMKAGVLPGRMFSFERYYADDRDAYYGALRSVRQQTFNMETWLEYFLRGLTEEYERVATTVADLSSLVPGGSGAPLRLNDAQQSGLTALRIQGRREFTRRDYQNAAGVGRTAATEGLQGLVRHGVLHSRGTGPGTRYAFAGAVIEGLNAAGRPTKWTDARIERELKSFLTGHTAWPGQVAFVAAGRRDLYAAASRNGGIKRWRAILGL